MVDAVGVSNLLRHAVQSALRLRIDDRDRLREVVKEGLQLPRSRPGLHERKDLDSLDNLAAQLRRRVIEPKLYDGAIFLFDANWRGRRRREYIDDLPSQREFAWLTDLLITDVAFLEEL